jgi:hypothetical protein
MNAVQEILLANSSHAKDCKEIKLLAQKFSSLTKHKTLSRSCSSWFMDVAKKLEAETENSV